MALSKSMLLRWLLLQIMVIMDISAETPTQKHEHITALRKQLLENYDKHALPSLNMNDTTDVYIVLAITSVWIDEGKQIMYTNAYTGMFWKDDRLKWDPKDYGGLDYVHMADSEIWRPDVMVINNADISEIDHYGNTYLWVKQGKVRWYPPASLQVECLLDLTYWPYDTQTCAIDFGSWTMAGDDINLRTYAYNKTKLYLGAYKTGTRYWNIVDSSIHTANYYIGNDRYYPVVHVSITLKRHSDTYGHVFIIPAFVISVMSLLQFVLPLTNSKRLTVGCSTALITTLMLIYIAHTIPPLGDKMPIIVKFYGQVLLMEMFILMMVCATLRLATSGPSLAPPQKLTAILTGPLSIVLRLNDSHSQNGKMTIENDDCEGLEPATGVSVNRDWILVATALDRVAALVFILIFIITLLAYVAPL